MLLLFENLSHFTDLLDSQLIEHDGGTVGHYSTVTRAPFDNVGIAILTNADNNGPFLQLVKFYLLEKALGLSHIDWEKKWVSSSSFDLN